MKMPPSIDTWLKEAKADPEALDEGRDLSRQSLA